MKRRFFQLHTITFVLLLAVLCSTRFSKIFTAQGQMPPAPDFNEMFKDFDFESFVKELDQQLKDIEDEEQAEKDNPNPSMPATRPQPAGQPRPQQLGTDQAPGYTNPEELPTDPVELITNPPIVKMLRDDKTVALPDKSAERALETYIEDIVTYLQKIDAIALGSNSEEFKEHYLATSQDTFVDLVVALSLIVSKRAYRVAILAPPAELEQRLRTYRTNIIKVRTELMKAAKSLTVTEEKEISSEELMRKKLEELARIPLVMTGKIPLNKPTTTASPLLNGATDSDDEDEEDDDMPEDTASENNLLADYFPADLFGGPGTTPLIPHKSLIPTTPQMPFSPAANTSIDEELL